MDKCHYWISSGAFLCVGGCVVRSAEYDVRSDGLFGGGVYG